MFMIVLFFMIFFIKRILLTDITGDDRKLVYSFVKSNANLTFQPPSGFLKFPYLIPSGYYHQLWDWDSMLMGVALLPFGSEIYLEGSMMNFLSAVNVTDGRVKGCLTPEGSSPTLYQAKPVLIQGAYISAANRKTFSKWFELKDKMNSFLKYWTQERVDPETGLPVWYDQMESGCDNLVYSNPPPTCTMCLSSTDIVVFSWRELEAMKLFEQHWHEDGLLDDEEFRKSQKEYTSLQQSLEESMMEYLWSPEDGVFMAYNTSDDTMTRHRVFMMGFPLWGGMQETLNESVVGSIVSELQKEDMNSGFGIRSTSSLDPRFNNKKEIDPDSNWQGPIWINSNALLAYGINSHGFSDFAKEISTNVVHVLAEDLRINGAWHECYNSCNGSALAAFGFLSWNTMSATLISNLEKNLDPYQLVF